MVWRGLFAFAALWNAIVGGAMAAAPARVAAQLEVSGPAAAYVVGLIGALIAVFGLGYAMVARAPARERGIVWVGLASKIAGAAWAAAYFAAGAVPVGTFAFGLGDAAFAAAFALFLWRGPRISGGAA